MTNKLFYGDNLAVLRESIGDETVDLVYLDPPFNSNAGYNVLFKAPAGQKSEAQIEAFEDTWHWTDSAARAYEDVIRSRHTEAATMLKAMRSSLGENDMMAYLAMMAARLVELHRVLKPTGSLYLHCDPTASHYLKILLDAVFGPTNFRSEIIWKRTFAHGNVTSRFGDVTDTILYFANGPAIVWNQQFRTLTRDQVDEKFRNQDPDGRRWQSVTLRNPGYRPNLHFPYTASNGITYQPHPNGWSCNLARLERYDKENRLHFPNSPKGALRLKMYADESLGERTQSLWEDIPPIGAQAQERLGYPTQKPLALLERIILTSSHAGQIVLDPFCGCGTAVHAAQKLERQWIGIDVTHLAISLIERRLKDAFPGIQFEVHGTPKDFDGARDLALRDKYQFEWWAVSLVDAVPQGGKKKGMDRGIDGVRWVRASPKDGDFEKVLVSVKGGENVGSAMVRDLKGTIEREGALGGMFITLTEPQNRPNKKFRPVKRGPPRAGGAGAKCGGGDARCPRPSTRALPSTRRNCLPASESVSRFRRRSSG